MPRSKMITKGCPACKRKLPVACKTCPCGNLFRKSAPSVPEKIKLVERVVEEPKPRTISSTISSSSTTQRRRTERVKREPPKFYDASQYEKPKRKYKVLRTTQRTSTSYSDQEEIRNRPKLKTKPKRSKSKDESEEKEAVDPEEDMMADLTAEQSFRFSVILADLNRKLGVVNPTF